MKLLGLGLGCAFVLGANGIHVQEREHQYLVNIDALKAIDNFYDKCLNLGLFLCGFN